MMIAMMMLMMLVVLPFCTLSLPVQGELELPADLTPDEEDLSTFLSTHELTHDQKKGGSFGGSSFKGVKLGGSSLKSSPVSKIFKASKSTKSYDAYKSVKVYKYSQSNYAALYYGSGPRFARRNSLGLIYFPYGRNGRYMRTASPLIVDPCNSANDGMCDVPTKCSAGDYADCAHSATNAPDGAEFLPAPTDNSSVVMLTIPNGKDGVAMWAAISAYLTAKFNSKQGKIYALCVNNAADLDSCFKQFVQVYTEELEPTQAAAQAAALASAPAVSLVQTQYTETNVLPTGTASTKYAWVEFVGDDATTTDLAAQLANDVANKDAALTGPAGPWITDATIISDSPAAILAPGLTLLAAVLAVLAVLIV
jgi:hypothetical protein